MGPGCREVLRGLEERSQPTRHTTEVQRQQEGAERLGGYKGTCSSAQLPQGPRAFPSHSHSDSPSSKCFPLAPYQSTLFKPLPCKSSLHLQTKAEISVRTTVCPETLYSFFKHQLHLPTSIHRRTGGNVAGSCIPTQTSQPMKDTGQEQRLVHPHGHTRGGHSPHHGRLYLDCMEIVLFSALLSYHIVHVPVPILEAFLDLDILSQS